MKRKTLIFLTVLAVLLSLSLPVMAAETGDGYIYDHADLLTVEEEARLRESAQSISDRYGCGIYALTVQDFTESGYQDVYDYAYDLYDRYALAENGLLLVLSMDGRDYALILNGSMVHDVFDSSALDRLERGFLEEFADNQWLDGFEVYYEIAGDTLDDPPPVTDSASPGYSGSPVQPSYNYEYDHSSSRSHFSVNALVIGFIAAGMTCLVLTRQLKTARKQSSARAYILDRGITFTHREDRFTHRTHRRRRVSSGSSGHGGGSRHRSGGGSRRSGRSGKF